MPINKQRLMLDIQTAQKKFGHENVLWAPDCSWVMINRFELPDNFSHFDTSIIILIPATYGYGGCYRDVFINRNLEVLSKDGGTYEKLGNHLHYFDKYPYSSMTNEMKSAFEKRDWGYLCLHDHSPNSGIVNYLYKIRLYLANIHKNWKAIFEGYQKH